jgi:hypothetical protein
MATVTIAVQREEVVPVVDDVIAQDLRPNGRIAERGVIALLRMELSGDANVAHSSTLLSGEDHLQP